MVSSEYACEVRYAGVREWLSMCLLLCYVLATSGGYRLVTARTRGDFIVLLNWEIRPQLPTQTHCPDTEPTSPNNTEGLARKRQVSCKCGL